MSAAAILEELAACGITPSVTADGTGIEVPAGRLTDEGSRAGGQDAVAVPTWRTWLRAPAMWYPKVSGHL